jgi:nuclear protein localization family protein 4
MPLEPYDQRYLEERKIKHLSFHAYIKKLTSADKNQAGGSGAATQYVAALEEPSYVVDRNCSAGHQPYPLSMCAKCQPSAIILQQQAGF